MARYEAPPDPNESDLRPKRPRRHRSDRRDWVPLFGLLLGALVTAAAIFVAWQFSVSVLSTDPLDGVTPIEPTIIRLTAPASPTPSRTPVLATPTPFATLTPIPTLDSSIAPDSILVGYYAEVVNTGGVGVTVRGGPSTDNVRLLVVNEGLVLLIIGGPQEGNGFTWWQVQMEDGTEGWAVADFLTPSKAPEDEG